MSWLYNGPRRDIIGQRDRRIKYDKSEKGRATKRRYEQSQKHKDKDRLRRLLIKIDVLAYYGKNGHPTCRWRGCRISDIDMLTLDHIDNNGAEYRKSGGCGGSALYIRLHVRGYVDGYQTLCHNHQWKKEILRRERLSLKCLT